MRATRQSRLEPSAPSYTEAEKHDAFEWLRLYALSNERGARHAAIALFTWGAEKSKTTELRDVLSELVRCMEGKPNRTHPFELVNAKAALTAPEAVPAPLSESTLEEAVRRIASMKPLTEESIHGERGRCQHCHYAWVIGKATELHDENCAYVIAKDALAERPGSSE